MLPNLPHGQQWKRGPGHSGEEDEVPCEDGDG